MPKRRTHRLKKILPARVWSPLLENFPPFTMPSFFWGWMAILAVAIIETFWASPAWLTLPSPWFFLVCPALAISIIWLFRWLPETGLPGLHGPISFSKKYNLGRKLFPVVEYLALCLSASFILCILSYLVCNYPYPLIDRLLHQWDLALGFDWLRWFRASLWLPAYVPLWIAYISLIPQFILFAVWFAWAGRIDRLYEVFWILFLVLLLAIPLSGFYPSIGPAFYLPWSPAELHMVQVRFGQAMTDVMDIRSHINLDFAARKPTGIITFPSYHTACAMVYIYAFRRAGIIGWAALVLNSLMLLSIPFLGNHYLADMLGGALLAFISILFVRILAARNGSGASFGGR